MPSKETQRAELHKTNWRIANDLRGSVDSWDFKSYVLGLLFHRFISENLTGYLNRQERAATDENLNETPERVLGHIEGSALGTPSEAAFKGLFDDLDVNRAKLGPTVAKRNEKLVKLLTAIREMDLGTTFTAHTIDTFGDASEFLMTMCASSGVSPGASFTRPKKSRSSWPASPWSGKPA